MAENEVAKPADLRKLIEKLPDITHDQRANLELMLHQMDVESATQSREALTALAKDRDAWERQRSKEHEEFDREERAKQNARENLRLEVYKSDVASIHAERDHLVTYRDNVVTAMNRQAGAQEKQAEALQGMATALQKIASSHRLT